ncbi:hypothetical protein [Leifsonia sp. NPDC080035]|uniref:Uncharacterized protein n=1 Tax=Leifsonia sp. NPDC080035 TaxID=3143936 RepID=A0AAU7GBW4_9MICO
MTAVFVPVRTSFSHRTAVRVGRALTAWGTRQPAIGPDHAARVTSIESSRDRAARLLPQLPR